MSAQIRTRNRVLEPCKKVITPEVFVELLEARKFAVARSQAKAHLKRLEEDQLNAAQPVRPVVPSGSSQDSESRHHGSPEGRPQGSSRSGNGAVEAMEVDSQPQEAGTQRKHDLKRYVKRQKAEADRLRREAERAEREAERKLQWAVAEEERLKQLAKVEIEQKALAKKLEALESEIKASEVEREPLNEQKAKLVAQLKQVLHAEEASRTRAASHPEEGETPQMASRVSTGSAVPMDSSA